MVQHEESSLIVDHLDNCPLITIDSSSSYRKLIFPVFHPRCPVPPSHCKMALSKRKRQSRAAFALARAAKQRRITEESTNSALPSPPLPPECSIADDSDTDPDESDSESEFSEQEFDQQDHWEDEDLGGTLSQPPLNAFTQLQYRKEADNLLRGGYGNGSRRTDQRRACEQRERSKIASKCYSIVDMFKKQKCTAAESSSISDEQPKNCRQNAQKELEDLLRLKVIMKDKFGPNGLQGARLRRYELVRSFFWAREKSPEKSRKDVALQVANSFNRGEHTARKILIWEQQWVIKREIEPTRCTASVNAVSMLEDNGVLLAAREYISGAGESK